jgi:hypothetical protein
MTPADGRIASRGRLAASGALPTQAETLCRGWGYAPNDPVCLNTFRRTGGQ